MAFTADTRADVDALHAKVQAAGCRIVFAPKSLDTFGGGYGFRFFSPDGLPFGISAEVTPGAARALARWDALPQKIRHIVFHSPEIGMTGISLGGYFAPRAVAFEPRFAAGAVWGANHDWAEVQQKRRRREGENLVPHYWSHVQWVFGAPDQEAFERRGAGMTLEGVVERIKIPFLVTHGEQDRQIGIEYARRTYDALSNSARRELRIFTAKEGGVEHVGADNMSFAATRLLIGSPKRSVAASADAN